MHREQELCLRTKTLSTSFFFNNIYSRTPMARTPLEPCKYVRDRAKDHIVRLVGTIGVSFNCL